MPPRPLQQLRHRLDWRALFANLALAGWLAADIVRILVFGGELSVDPGSSLVDYAEMAVLAVTVVFVLGRPRALQQDTSPSTIAIAFGAALLPLAYGVVGTHAHSALSAVAQGIAILIMGSSLLCLRDNFSILPQYRSIVTTGPFRLVRHPIYASYLLFDGPIAFGSGNVLGVMLWIGEFWLLAIRAQFEEQLLAASDPEYEHFRAVIRWRLIPYLH